MEGTPSCIHAIGETAPCWHNNYCACIQESTRVCPTILYVLSVSVVKCDSWEVEADSITDPDTMEEKTDVDMAENPFESYIESLRQELEDQDPIFIIGIIVALAAVVITIGKPCNGINVHVSLGLGSSVPK